MSRPSIHIIIPKPCHERWESMDTTNQGAFCHSCQKEVIDFSTMTDREVIEYLSKHQTGCGRFRKDQVDTKLTIPEVNNGMFKWKAILLSVLSMIGLKSLIAQTTSTTTLNQSSSNKIEHYSKKPQSLSDTIKLPEISITSTYSSHRSFEMGLIAESPTLKPIKEKIVYEFCEEPAKYKHKALNWFRRLFGIKKRS